MKNLLHLFIAVTFFAFFANPSELQAQDPHLAQFYAAPTHTNPALLGVFNGRFRVNMNYREQWASIINNNPFRTMAGSFEMRHGVGRNDFLSYGVSVLRDEAGTSRYTRNQGTLGVSYMKKLSGGRYGSGTQFLIAGAQAGGGQHSIQGDKLWFSNQYDFDAEEVNFNAASGEGISNMSDFYIDFNAGLMWYAVFDDNMSIYAGGSLHHINAPRITFFESGDAGQLDMKWNGQIGGELPLSRELSMLPAVIVMGQGPSLNTIFGTNFRYTNRDWREIAIRIGVWGDLVNNLDSGLSFPSMIYTAVLEMGRWNVGLSYDVNAGALTAPTNSRGAFEISASYVHPATRKEKVKCPKL